MALRCAAGDTTGETFDGVLAIDPNLEESTCYLTGMFSRLDPTRPGATMEVLHQVGAQCETVEEWRLVHDHIVNCVDKLDGDLSAMVRQCQEIAGPFTTIEAGTVSPFVQWFRQASEYADQVRRIFADDQQKRAIIAGVRLQHLEDGCLGAAFNNEAFTFVPHARHLDLMGTDVYLQQMIDFVGPG